MEFSSPAYTPTLVPVGPTHDPSKLVLRLEVTVYDGQVAGVHTERSVRYESDTHLDVDTVTILPLGLDLEVGHPV